MSAKENLQMKDGSQAIFKVHEAAEPKAVMMVLHGFAEHIGRYARAAEFFTACGITLCVHDQRGFGEAVFDKKRMRGVAESYDLFLDDADVVYDTITARFPGLPVILFGHSMGGNIALSYLFTRPQTRFAMAILETPWLRLYAPLNRRLLSVSKRLGVISPTLAIRTAPGSKYRRKGRGIESDKYHYNRLSFRMIAAMSEAGEDAISRAADVQLPTLLMAAGRDTVVSTPAMEEFYAGAGPNMQYACIQGGKHALHNDKPAPRADAFGVMLGFIEDQLQRQQHMGSIATE